MPEETEARPESAEANSPADPESQKFEQIDRAVAMFRDHLMHLSTESLLRVAAGLDALALDQLPHLAEWMQNLARMDAAHPDATRRLWVSVMGSGPAQWDQIATWAQDLAAANADEPANAAWRRQVGPALSQADVARLLGKSQQAVQKDRRLLMLRQPGTNRPVYPVMQFHERRPISGVADVLAALRESLLPESIAAWLTSERTDLDGRRPIDVLRDMPADGRVLELARRLAASAA